MFIELIPTMAPTSSGELFRQILPFVFVGTVLITILHLGLTLIYRGNPAPRSKLNWWDVLIYLGLLGCVAVLGGTSFVGVIRDGELGGWLLFFHMFGAGTLTAVLPLLALTWAHQNRLEIRPTPGNSRPPKFYWLPKLMFWTILASGFVVTTTMLISMQPILGSDGLHTLLDVHRYSGLVLVVAAALHLYGITIQRIGLR